MEQINPTVNRDVLPIKKTKKYAGEVVYIFAFDIAYELQIPKIKELFEQPIAEFGLDISKRSPKQLLLHRSYMVRLPPIERIGPDGLIQVSRNVKLFQVGAISITVRVPFEVDHFSELVRYHDLEFKSGPLYDEVKTLANQVLEKLKPYCVRPVNQIGDEEAYTVFCINSPVLDSQMEPVNTEIWFKSHRRQIASLLTQEPDQSILSKQESDESTERYLTYYENDLVVIDWDAALIIDEPKDFDEVLYIMELANLHLAELEAYDKILDQSIDRAYNDLYMHALFQRGNIMRDLREIKVDMTRISDELLNITKFFGDWHLARIYEIIASRFHLSDWYRIINEKLKTLGEIYQLLYQDKMNQWMLILEFTIVLLFIIDLIVLIIGLP
ncbi:MAG TPA: hypothetical protein PLW02_05385 [Verrucomicrobiota bacterium]|mgnify:CR=1 FL=1|nr:hypothetical protein [Verrucomicrobiota bacterium]